MCVCVGVGVGGEGAHRNLAPSFINNVPSALLLPRVALAEACPEAQTPTGHVNNDGNDDDNRISNRNKYNSNNNKEITTASTTNIEFIYNNKL